MPSITAHHITQVFTIALEEATSDEWGIAEFNKGSIQIPTMTGTSLQLEGSNDKVTWVELGTAITVATAALQALPDAIFVAKYMRIVSNAAAGEEAAERQLTVLLKGSS